MTNFPRRAHLCPPAVMTRRPIASPWCPTTRRTETTEQVRGSGVVDDGGRSAATASRRWACGVRTPDTHEREGGIAWTPRRRDKATTNVSETGKTVMSAADRVKVTLEVRWFVRGELPTGRWGKGAVRHRRTDHYYLPSLSERSSLKRRGGGSLERKERLGVPIPVARFGGNTRAERWAKCRNATMPATDSGDMWRDGDLTAVRHARPLGDRRGGRSRREPEA